MEGVGGRLGRSSTRYGPTIVFTGPVRKWKKKWIHVAPPTTNNNNNTKSNGTDSLSNDATAHLKLYKWTPISQTQTQSQSQNDDSGDGVDGDDDDQPPRRKIKYIPIALLEEQNKDSPEENADESVATDSNSKFNHVNGKPDINDVPMEDNQASEETNVGRQDLNESTLDLNARDGDEDSEAR
ncbi:hypothetical protein CTI12_AA325660 [Artemisia annua]|uniref:Uncharacterized protein n=1 Tax=Artemisia annua TaxID=35608 RepID=A0A2U1LME0_ARTAN|nr:hypothetical protein CTI12_AA325660 [Artemisia annua]